MDPVQIERAIAFILRSRLPPGDAYPFGGCNTVVDSLYVRKLIVCREGTAWYNRIGPAMLRTVGLPELVVTTEEQYIDTIFRLIHDDDFRSNLQERLDHTDLDATIFDRVEAQSFRKAVAVIPGRRIRTSFD